MQVLVNAICMAAYYFLAAVGVALVLRVERFIDFSLGVTAAVAAYIFFGSLSVGVPPAVGVGLALGAAAAYSVIARKVLFQTLEARTAPAHILMIASLGLVIVTENLISVAYGDAVQRLFASARLAPWALGRVSVTPVQALLVAASLVYGGGLACFLKFSRTGLAVRAIMDNFTLARLSGLDLDRGRLVARLWAASALALAGLFQAVELGLRPGMGMPLLLSGAIAAFLCGNTLIWPLAVSAMALSVIERLTVYHFSGNWQDTTTFVFLGACLLLMPKKILWKMMRRTRY